MVVGRGVVVGVGCWRKPRNRGEGLGKRQEGSSIAEGLQEGLRRDNRNPLSTCRGRHLALCLLLSLQTVIHLIHLFNFQVFLRSLKSMDFHSQLKEI